jgi:hypothetical protein
MGIAGKKGIAGFERTIFDGDFKRTHNVLKIFQDFSFIREKKLYGYFAGGKGFIDISNRRNKVKFFLC